LFTKYYSGDQVEKKEMGGAYSTYGEEEWCIKILVGKPDGKRPFGRPTHRWEDNIMKNIQEVGWADWTGLIWLWTGTCGRLL